MLDWTVWTSHPTRLTQLKKNIWHWLSLYMLLECKVRCKRTPSTRTALAAFTVLHPSVRVRSRRRRKLATVYTWCRPTSARFFRRWVSAGRLTSNGRSQRHTVPVRSLVYVDGLLVRLENANVGCYFETFYWSINVRRWYCCTCTYSIGDAQDALNLWWTRCWVQCLF